MDVEVRARLEMNERVDPVRAMSRSSKRGMSVADGHVSRHVLFRVVGAVLSPARRRQVYVLLEDVAEHIGVDLVRISRRSRVEVPGEPVEEPEDPLEIFVTNADRLSTLDRVRFEDSTVDVRDVGQQFRDSWIGVLVRAGAQPSWNNGIRRSR